MVYHIVFMLFSPISMLYSLEARSPISTQASTFCINPISRAFWNVNPSFGNTSKPTLSLICFQCRSTSPFFLNDTINGTFGLNSSICSLTLWAIFSTGPISRYLKNLMTPARTLTDSSTNFSAATASSVSHSPDSQFLLLLNHWSVVTHRLL
jgi:hypothetical protein